MNGNFSSDLEEFICEQKLKEKNLPEGLVKAADLKKGDWIRLTGVEHYVVKVTNTCVFYSMENRALKSCSRIGRKSQQWIERIGNECPK